MGIGEIGSRSIEDIESAGLTRGQITKGKIKDGTFVCRSFLEEINIDEISTRVSARIGGGKAVVAGKAHLATGGFKIAFHPKVAHIPIKLSGWHIPIQHAAINHISNCFRAAVCDGDVALKHIGD